MVDHLRSALLAHYDAHARRLPWRESRDPYRIWVSEIMLQQTRVATVLTRYQQFLARFPSVRALASARPEEVCEEWAGLGYYSRARNLHSTAREIVAAHGGRLPRESAALLELPGIGPYTAGAISSIAFGTRVAAVDGNVERVICRLYAIDASSGKARRTLVHSHASKLADCSRAGDINQALMDVGAAICTPRSPQCDCCPITKQCKARTRGITASLPLRAPRAARRVLRVAMAWIERDGGEVLLEQRALGGLWAGQWQLPAEEGARARRRLESRLDCALAARGVTVRHLLTHRDVRATVYSVHEVCTRELPRVRWSRSPDSAPLSALARKAVAAFRRSRLSDAGERARATDTYR